MNATTSFDRRIIRDAARPALPQSRFRGFDKSNTSSPNVPLSSVTLQTTSTHLSKLLDGNLVVVRKQGRHRYFELASPRVAGLIEALMGLAADRGEPRTRTGPRDEALRFARRCYNHLAGAAGVRMYDSLVMRGYLSVGNCGLTLSSEGYAFAERLGLDLAQLSASRTPLCRECLDWSERKTHLAGSLGRALLDHMVVHGWVRSHADTRALSFTKSGAKQFDAAFPTNIEAVKMFDPATDVRHFNPRETVGRAS